MLLPIIQACAARTQAFSVAEANALLVRLTPVQQAQLISAMYMGRNSLHIDNFTEDDAPHATPEGLAKYTDHIPQADYARILNEKDESTLVYFKRFVICARNAGLNF